MTPDEQTIQNNLLEFLADEVDVVAAPGVADSRIGCLTPLEYPDGDNVVVWVRPEQGRFFVSDYGEALPDPPKGRGDRAAFKEAAKTVVDVFGVEFDVKRGEGHLFARCDQEQVGEYVWAVASAAARLAQIAAGFPPRKSELAEQEEPAPEFTQTVTRVFETKNVKVQRDHSLKGSSGHVHKATIYIPTNETVVEPVRGHWNQVTSAYAKLGDLKNANGYRLFSLLDDREGADEDVAGLLAQVSDVVEWTRRDEWFDAIAWARGT